MPRKLEVGCEMNMQGAEDIDYLDLPDEWDAMTEDEREKWADEALETHVSNSLNTWHTIVDRP